MHLHNNNKESIKFYYVKWQSIYDISENCNFK